jgi:hypothetical protein
MGKERGPTSPTGSYGLRCFSLDPVNSHDAAGRWAGPLRREAASHGHPASELLDCPTGTAVSALLRAETVRERHLFT